MATATKEKTAPAVEVIDKETGEVVVQAAGGALQAADDYSGYEEDIGQGYENQDSEDISLPFISQMQPGSPQVLDSADKEDGIKAGSWINSATGVVFSGKEGFTFVPACTEHMLVEWKPNNGGFVGRHAMDSELAKTVRASQVLGQYSAPNGNDLSEAFYVYGLALDADGGYGPAVLGFKSTTIRIYRDWMYRARSVVLTLPDGRKLTKLPLFAHAWNIKTRYPIMKNDQGSWYVPEISFAGKGAPDSRIPPGSDLYLAAKTVKDSILAGTVKAAQEVSGREGGAEVAPKSGTDAKSAPF